MYIDFHAHILPGVDDGAKTFDEAVKLLKSLESQGVKAVSLSPHFFPALESSLEEYKERIIPKFEAFREAVKDICPELYLGYEVHYFSGLAATVGIKDLCIANTKYMLLELPYRRISTRTINNIIELNLSRGITPILAHIERYRKFECYDRLLSLIEDGYALGQINAYSLLKFKSRRATLKLIKDGYVSFIASDTHSIDKIPPRIEEALSFIEKKLGKETANTIKNNHDSLYKEISKEKEED